tara:strand:- start:701 stop:1654 length:954 start_codon:yes stop_codon:yes gene_type:complete
MSYLPAVSVIMPAYNAANTIAESIESVLNQNYSNFKLYIVDHGSSDNTSIIIKKFDDNRIIYLFQPNLGFGSPGLPRNLALKHIDSKYIAFLDSDDLWLPNKLKEQIEYFESLDDNFALVYSNFRVFTSKPSDSSPINRKNLKFFNNVFYDLILSNFIGLPTVIIKANALKEVGFFRTDLKGIEDWDLWLRISKIFKISYISKEHALYRISPNSMSGDKIKCLNLEKNYIRDYLTSSENIPSKVFTISLLLRESTLLKLNTIHSKYFHILPNILGLFKYTILGFPISFKFFYFLLKCLSSRVSFRYFTKKYFPRLNI